MLNPLRRMASVLTLAIASTASAQQVGPDGWTQFSPSADSRLIYVSTTGSDSNSGLTPSDPLQTIAAGVGHLRDGYPDWLLLKSGETWNEVIPPWEMSGRSASEPMRVAVYGGSERATLLCGTTGGLGGYTGGLTPRSHVAFTDLAFLANGYDGINSPASGISFLGSWSDILLENVSVSGFFDNVVFQSDRTQEVMQDIRIRRCIISDAFRVGPEHSQGCYLAGIDGLLLEDCVFDHNGWNESVPGADPDIYRHNIYIQGHNGAFDDCTNVTVRGVISARAAATGMQQRPGGICESSLFISNPIGVVFGTDGGTLTDCVVVGSRDIDPTAPRGWGFNLVNGSNMTALRCITAGGPLMGTQSVIGYGINNATNILLQNCVSWHWQNAAGVGMPVEAVNAPWPTVTGGDMEQSQPSHGVTVEDYMSSLGQTATVDAYMTQARQQSRALWRSEYTAGAFNTWAEQAFGLTAAPSCYPNCDGSTAAPILNVLDFSCFLQKYAAADPYANCDGSTITPVLNVLDFTCFLQKFAQGCHTDPGGGG